MVKSQPLVPVKVTLFGNRVFADGSSEVKMSTGVGPSSNMIGVLIRGAD